jgi:glycosyltransferase involved in cell wall biosynthesis
MRRAEPSIRHVLMTADAVGGVWTYALDLARELAGHGVRVSLVVMGPTPSASQRDEVAAVPGASLLERACALEWMDRPWSEVDAAGPWLLDLERQLQPDVVHLNGYCHAALAWAAPVLVAGHSCVLSWWRAVHGGDPPACWDEYAGRVAGGLRAAGLVVAPTADMLARLQLHYGPLRRGRVIANGRAAGAAAPPARKEPFVLTAGRLWDQAKNVEAVAAVAGRVPWPVYIAGETTHPATDQSADAGAASGAARWLGRLSAPDLAAWMARASIFALPVRYEPFGLSAVEAALAGCALVLGDIRSQREVWRDAACFVPPDNRRALAAAIERLAGDRDVRAQMSARARLRALELTPDRMAREYLSAYDDVVRAARPLPA